MHAIENCPQTEDIHDSISSSSTRISWPRQVASAKQEQAEQLDSPWVSVRQIAEVLDVPRSTLQDWRKQKQLLLQHSGLSIQVVEFFESSAGLSFLHEMLAAMHLVFGQRVRHVKAKGKLEPLKAAAAGSVAGSPAAGRIEQDYWVFPLEDRRA